VDRGLETIKLGWKEYMQQPVLPASLAYVLLFFNVVLAPSSLMTAFLTQRGTLQTLCTIIMQLSLLLENFRQVLKGLFTISITEILLCYT
jgi:hypothetical protein